MKKIYFLIFTIFFCNYNLIAQEIDADATTTSISFTNEEGYTNSTHVNNLSDFIATSTATARQIIINGGDSSGYHRMVVKTQYQRHQKNLAITGTSGDIITLKIKFKINGTLTANAEVFTLGLKSVLDASNTQPFVGGSDAATRNGEVLSIHNNASENLNIRYKTNAATAGYATDASDAWKELTIKYFIGNEMANSRIKAKLDNGSASSGWVNQSWTSQLLYDAITTGSGAYMIFASNTALGSDASANHLWIDQYDFTTSGDEGLIFLGGGFVAAGSWNTQVSPTSTDRLFLFGNTANMNNGANDFSYKYMYLDPATTLNVTNVNSLVLDDLDVDGTLDIKTGDNSVTINNNLTIDNSATAILTDGSSLIVNGTASGNLTYTRTLATDNWYAITSPVGSQDIDAFIAAEGLAQSENNTNVGLSQSYSANLDEWTYYTTSSSGSGNFTQGKGYIIKLASAGDISFTGNFRNSDISRSLQTAGNGFNFVANPFTSYTDMALLLPANDGVIQTQTIWVWNTVNGSYDTKVTGDSYKLAPGQAFFVQSKSDAVSLALNTSYQTHHTSDTFQRIDAKPEIHLSLSDGSLSRFAKIYYTDNATTGFDNGWDGETFGGITNPFDIFTNLVTGNQGKKYQVQSLPKSDMESTIVPVGITADTGEEITFTAEVMNLPAGLKVFLEDRQTNTFTRLDEANTEYTITLDKALNDIGRFYLHTSASALSTQEVHLEHISVYTTNSNNLRIVGIAQGNASVKLYNIVGKEVLSHNFTSNGVSDIALPKVTRGIYIVQLTTEEGKLNKKIVLE